MCETRLSSNKMSGIRFISGNMREGQNINAIYVFLFDNQSINFKNQLGGNHL